MFSHLGLRTDGTMLEISATLLQKLFLDKNSVRTRVYINPGAYRKMKEGFFMPHVKIIYIEKAFAVSVCTVHISIPYILCKVSLF